MPERLRGPLSAVLVIAGTACLLVGFTARYADDALFDATNFADRATSVLDDKDVRAEIADQVTVQAIRLKPDLIAVQPAIHAGAGGLVATPQFQQLLRDSVEDLHRALFQRDRESVTLRVADTGVLASATVRQFAPGIASQIPDDLDVKLLSITDDGADNFWTKLAQRAQENERYEKGGLFGAALCFLLALVVARRRRRAVSQVALGVGVVGIVLVVAFYMGRLTVADHAHGAQAQAAVETVFNAFFLDLRDLSLWLAGAGIAVAAFVSLGGRVVEELTDEDEPEPERAPAQGSRVPRLIGVTAGAVALIAFGAISVAGASKDEDPPFEVKKCNGSAALCDRALDDVVFPSTHNSMSAASEPGWLFPAQENGVAEQLKAGIRGLLIDTHYGIKTPRGVYTVLEKGGKSREKLAGPLGPQGLATVEAIRRRIGFKPKGEEEIFWCHAFCELGATKGTALLESVRDFLVTHPYEVLLISIEDEASPESTEKLFDDAGLTDYVYRGSLNPLPTLRELIDSGERVVVMGEEHVGDVPWFRQQFSLVQETPFKFGTVAELDDPGNCDLNRGESDNPLLLVNHWVDTSPAPRPGNARRANAAPELLGRARRCERRRGKLPNLLAVDFYKEGDLFKVAAELNRRPDVPAKPGE